MQQKLSAEKYIQSRARNLPIFKCLVNSNWESIKTATVFIVRRHTNGNLTWGAYEVDLLCRGIMATAYEFNALPIELDEWLEEFSDEPLVEINYTLAHNIVYAGHDFAMDFHINPHPDFINVTRYLLEEDDDKIELIDVPTGDDEGRPHLVVRKSGEDAGILSKLKQYAGEGNYYYTLLKESNFEKKEDADDEDNDEFNEDDNEPDDEEIALEDWDKEEWIAYITDTPEDHFIYNLEIIAYIHRKIIAQAALKKLGVDREELIQKAVFGLTDEPIFEEMSYQPSEFEKPILESVHKRLFNTKKYPGNLLNLVSDIQGYIKQWPANPILRNYLYNAYILCGRKEKAMNVISETRNMFPGYLFGNAIYADWLVQQGRTSEVAAVFNGCKILSCLYPDRKRFHISEFVEFTTVWLFYYLTIRDNTMAGIYGQLLEEYCPTVSIKKKQEDLLDLLNLALLMDIMPLLLEAKVNLAKKYELASLLAAS